MVNSSLRIWDASRTALRTESLGQLFATGADEMSDVAVHGGGGVGSAVSAGCLHASEPDLRYLMRAVPLGTPSPSSPSAASFPTPAPGHHYP